MLSRHSRPGVSLVELIVVLAIVGVAAGAVTRIATRQQRHYGSLVARTMALGRLREGADVLVSELAGIVPVAGDIHDGGMGRSSISFRAPMQTLVLCAATDPGTSELVLASVWPANDSTDTGDDVAADEWIAAGDSIWLYDARADTAGATAGEVWSAHLVTAAARIRHPCLGDSAGVPAVRVAIALPVGHSLERLAPARVFRAVRYALYRAADAGWYLGFTDCRPLARSPACAPMQPVAGPYLADVAPSDVSRGGLVLEYLDAAGAPTDDRVAVAAIRVTLRANAALPGAPADTVAVTRTIGFRNTPP